MAKQTDIEPGQDKTYGTETPADNTMDRAIRAVRDYQKGQCTTSFVRANLQACEAEDLATIAIATRVPSGQLERLRNGAKVKAA